MNSELKLNSKEDVIFNQAYEYFSGDYRSTLPLNRSILLFADNKMVDVSFAYQDLVKKVEALVDRRGSVDKNEADNVIAGLMAACVSRLCRDVNAEAVIAMLPGQRPIDPNAFKAKVTSGAIKSVLQLEPHEKRDTAMLTVQFRDQNKYFVAKVCDVLMTPNGAAYQTEVTQQREFANQNFAGRFDDLFCHRSNVERNYPLSPGIKKQLRTVTQKVKGRINVS